MAEQVTTWRPDTCNCTISYSWDDSVPAEKRVHTYITHDSETLCEAHAHLDSTEAFDSLVTENVSKNLVVNKVAEDHADLYNRFDAEKSQSVPDASKVPYVFDENRNLVIDTTGLDQVKAQAILDSAQSVDVPLTVSAQSIMTS
jgi:hypothetical protein